MNEILRLPTVILIAAALASLSVVDLQAAAPAPVVPRDVLYTALFGAPEDVDPDALVATPGRHVGRAVRTRGRLVAVNGGAARFELAIGKTRVLLRLEPEVKALVTARLPAWDRTLVTAEGFFYREVAADAAATPFALRAWTVFPANAAPAPPPPSGGVALVPLQDLVYGAGRYDGREIRVRGTYRGSNRHADLPEKTRKSRADWVIKDGYFAAWITGRDASGDNWDLSRRSSSGTEAVVEVVGVPSTAGGVVRIQAREVELSLDFAGGALAQPRDAGLQSVSPRVSFAWPIAGDVLRRPGHMVLQFSKPLDPQSLESRVRVRYPRTGTEAPAVSYEYRQRYRALIVTPEPPPPPDAEVVVELLEGVIDVDGRALAPQAMTGPGEAPLAEGVAAAVRFRSGR